MTYKDLCINVLLRMGEEKNIVSENITQTTTIAGYLKAIPALLSDALSYLVTAGRFITKTYEIAVNPPENLISPDPVISAGLEDLTYSAEAGSYFFEVRGSCSITLTVNGVSSTLTNASGHKVFKGTASAKCPISIVFKAGYPYTIHNLSLYGEIFADDASVFERVPEKQYDLSTLLSDFYALNEEEITVDGDGLYRWESSKSLAIDHRRRAVYRITYFAYPQTIPSTITDATVLNIDPELYAVIPLYIEGKLRMINDEDYATTILNEFESRRAELIANKPPRMTATVREVLL